MFPQEITRIWVLTVNCSLAYNRIIKMSWLGLTYSPAARLKNIKLLFVVPQSRFSVSSWYWEAKNAVCTAGRQIEVTIGDSWDRATCKRIHDSRFRGPTASECRRYANADRTARARMATCLTISRTSSILAIDGCQKQNDRAHETNIKTRRIMKK